MHELTDFIKKQTFYIDFNIKWYKMKELDWEWVEVTTSAHVVVVAFLAGAFFC